MMVWRNEDASKNKLPQPPLGSWLHDLLGSVPVSTSNMLHSCQTTGRLGSVLDITVQESDNEWKLLGTGIRQISGVVWADVQGQKLRSGPRSLGLNKYFGCRHPAPKGADIHEHAGSKRSVGQKNCGLNRGSLNAPCSMWLCDAKSSPPNLALLWDKSHWIKKGRERGPPRVFVRDLLLFDTRKYRCRNVRVYPAECGQEFGTDALKSGNSKSLVLKSFLAREHFGTRVPSSLPHMFGYACTLHSSN